MVTEKLTDRWKWTTNASGGVVGASDREYHCSNLESASFPREVIVKDETYSILAKPPVPNFLGPKCRRAPLSSDYQQKNMR